MTRGPAALLGLLLFASGCAATAEERRDQTLNTALEAGRLACLTILANPEIKREPGVNEYCLAVVNGCPR